MAAYAALAQCLQILVASHQPHFHHPVCLLLRHESGCLNSLTKQMNILEAIATLQQIAANAEHTGTPGQDIDLVIPHEDEYGQSKFAGIESILPITDNQRCRVVLNLNLTVTSLSSADKENIATSIRLGHSWHTYSEMKRMSKFVEEMHSCVNKVIDLIETGQTLEAMDTLKEYLNKGNSMHPNKIGELDIDLRNTISEINQLQRSTLRKRFSTKFR